MRSLAAILPQLLVLVAVVYLQPVTAQWTSAQATWYDGIFAGFCGFFNNIPENQFVGKTHGLGQQSA